MSLSDKVAMSIKRLKQFEPPEGYYLAFSGGKDSVVIKRLAQMAGVKFDAHYNAPTVDAAPVRHLSRESVYEPFYQWLGQPTSSNLWDELRSMIDDLVEACGAKMDKEDEHD